MHSTAYSTQNLKCISLCVDCLCRALLALHTSAVFMIIILYRSAYSKLCVDLPFEKCYIKCLVSKTQRQQASTTTTPQNVQRNRAAAAAVKLNDEKHWNKFKWKQTNALMTKVSRAHIDYVVCVCVYFKCKFMDLFFGSVANTCSNMYAIMHISINSNRHVLCITGHRIYKMSFVLFCLVCVCVCVWFLITLIYRHLIGLRFFIPFVSFIFENMNMNPLYISLLNIQPFSWIRITLFISLN